MTVDGEVRVVEEQDFVYRDRPGTASPAQPETPDARAARTPRPWQLEIEPHPILLFRFSALTWNTHRIHYDRPYATDVESYAGLVVHGPLLALLLLELPRRLAPDRQVVTFSWRTHRPLFEYDRIEALGGLSGDDGVIAALSAGSGGRPAVEGTAELAAR